MSSFPKKSRIISIALVIIAIAISSSCVMQQGITLQANNSGWSTTDLIVDDFFIAVLEDFAPFSPEKKQKTIMEESVDDFVRMLYEMNSASNISVIRTGENGFFIDFDFTSLQQFLLEMNKQQPQSILTFRQAGNRTTMTFNLDMKNYPQLAKMIPFLADPNFETFGPLYNEGMSPEDYLDMISYILGEEGPDAIMESVISMRFTTPAAIVSHQGGKKLGINTVQFDMPLIDILLLAKPITFNVTW